MTWEAPAEITTASLRINGVSYELRHAACWDPGPGDIDRATVYYEDEDRPDDATPLYHLVPLRVVEVPA